MSSAITFVLQNEDGHIHGVQSIFQDYSLSNPIDRSQRIKRELESASVVTTLLENHIEITVARQEFLIKRRNKIVDNRILLIFPSRRKELKKIDEELDRLDLQLASKIIKPSYFKSP